MKKLVKFALAAALGSIFAATTVPANAAVTLRMGYETPRTDSQHKGAQVFKKIVEKKLMARLR